MADFNLKTRINGVEGPANSQNSQWDYDDTDEDHQVANSILILEEGDELQIEIDGFTGTFVVDSFKLVRISDTGLEGTP